MIRVHGLSDISLNMDGPCGRVLNLFSERWTLDKWALTPENSILLLRDAVTSELSDAIKNARSPGVLPLDYIQGRCWAISRDHTFEGVVRDEAAEIGLAIGLMIKPQPTQNVRTDGRLGQPCRRCWRTTDGIYRSKTAFVDCHLHRCVAKPESSASDAERDDYLTCRRERKRVDNALKVAQELAQSGRCSIERPRTDLIPIGETRGFRARKNGYMAIFDGSLESWRAWLSAKHSEVCSYIDVTAPNALIGPTETLSFLESRPSTLAEHQLYKDPSALYAPLRRCREWLEIMQVRRS